MNYTINSYITPYAAARLLVQGEIDLLGKWSESQTIAVLNEVKQLNAAELLCIVDSNKEIEDIASGNIPQFGHIDTVLKIPHLMLSEKELNLDYVQMGFLLKKDPKASLLSNQKFGENHGKMAAQMGIINCIANHFVPSTISESFANGFDYDNQLEIAMRLYIRIPLIRKMLKDAKLKRINGYDYMSCLGESTKARRASNVRNILNSYRKMNESDMDFRLDNIIWERIEV